MRIYNSVTDSVGARFNIQCFINLLITWLNNAPITQIDEQEHFVLPHHKHRSGVDYISINCRRLIKFVLLK